MGDNFQYFNAGGELFAQGELADPGATPGDVLTVQDDGSIAAEAGGGSQPYPSSGHGSPACPITASSRPVLGATTTAQAKTGAINLAAALRLAIRSPS